MFNLNKNLQGIPKDKKKKNLKRKGNHQNHIHIGIYFENVGQEMFDNYN